MRVFIENNNIDVAADILASSSTPDYPILSTVADVIDNTEKILRKEDLGDPDLTTKETKSNDSEPSKFIPIDSLSARIVSIYGKPFFKFISDDLLFDFRKLTLMTLSTKSLQLSQPLTK